MSNEPEGKKQEALEWWEKLREAAKKNGLGQHNYPNYPNHQGVCPNCGYCPVCGRPRPHFIG